MAYKQNEILQFVEENDVKFIRLAFCDIFGNQKNIAIMPGELERAFRDGISFDASAICGFNHITESDLFLVPDANTIAVLPWRPSHGRVARFFCDIRNPDGAPFEGDVRHLLKQTVAKLEQSGFTPKIGAECEFYLFHLDDKDHPTLIPFDEAGYFDIAPADQGENVRREICLTLEQIDIIPESSHHERGPGQNEIVFRYSDALSAADQLMTFKTIVKTIANRNGLYASFMPQPFSTKSGSGLHINLSLFENNINIFDRTTAEHGAVADSFIAGVMEKIADITTFLNPTTNSYSRLGEFEAPKYITWSHHNRSQLIRIPAAKGALSRMELRSPDPAANPYLAFALLLEAGLWGIHHRAILQREVDIDLDTAHDAETAGLRTLPESLEEAVKRSLNSEFVRSVMPEKTLSQFCARKSQEAESLVKAGNRADFERQTYFLAL